ncbi:MAG: hypothetical protein LBF56_01385 [Holosporales bacterium]|nr:hypothetical protein [Holosporales bacterium]
MELMAAVSSTFGTIALVTTIIGQMPQVYKAYRTKSTRDISMVMLINCLVCSASWLVYGTLEETTYVIWSNMLALVISVISILQKRLYDQKGQCFQTH